MPSSWKSTKDGKHFKTKSNNGPGLMSYDETHNHNNSGTQPSSVAPSETMNSKDTSPILFNYKTGHYYKPSQAISKEPSPVFETYDDALEWIAQKNQEYGSKQKFSCSEEFSKVYPSIKQLYDQKRDQEKEEHKKICITAMNSVGANYGDTVEYSRASPFGEIEFHEGKIINRKGIPYVKAANGKTKKWHKGYRDIKHYLAAKIGTEI